MRDLIIHSIMEYAEYHRGFNPESLRWRRGGTKRNPGNDFCINSVHISEVDWTTLSDADLLSAFEMIAQRHVRQM